MKSNMDMEKNEWAAHPLVEADHAGGMDAAWEKPSPRRVHRTPRRKTKGVGLLARLPALPKFSDPGQKRAAGNIVKFLAALLILTLVARGTAGATLARVVLENPSRSEIIQAVTGNATISAKDSLSIMAPQGLTIEEMLVGIGQSVEIGDAVARFDIDEIQEKLARETAALDELRLNLKKLQRNDPVDDSALQSAQRTLQRAQEDYNTTKLQGEASVAEARTEIGKAETNEQTKLNALNNVAATAGATARQAWEAAKVVEQEKLNDLNTATAGGDQVAIDAAQQAWEAAQAETKAKLAAYNSAVDSAEASAYQAWEAAQTETQKAWKAWETAQEKAQSDLLSATRKIEDAQASIDKSEQDYAKSAQQAADTAAKNSLDAQIAMLDIEKQEEVVNELKMMQANEGLLYADVKGVVSKTLAQGAAIGTEAAVILADGTGLFEASLLLDKTDAERLAVGDECDVSTSGGSMYYNPVVTGTISQISAPNDTNKVTVTIRLPEGEWTGGQTVQVQVVQSRDSYDTCIPLTALHSDNSGYYILTIEQRNTVLGIENVVIQMPVTVSATDDNTAAISGPVNRNALIITSSNKTVQAGDRVRESSE